jgi:primosomal protein N' (replication factor Y)
VVVQSYSPYHEAISAAMEQDVEGYYDYEIDHRAQLQFPPVSRLVLIRTRGPTESAVELASRQLHERLKPQLPQGATLIPPTPSPILKKRGLFHYQMLIYTTRIGSLVRVLKRVIADYSPPTDVRIIVDVDTFNMS